MTDSEREPAMFKKYVLRLGYELTGDTDIHKCTECGKKRLTQIFEKGRKKAFVCEQCSFGLSDSYFTRYYTDMVRGDRHGQ